MYYTETLVGADGEENDENEEDEEDEETENEYQLVGVITNICLNCVLCGYI